jgi:hypothetical protein
MTKFGECLADEALADEIADGLRAKIRQLGETPCVPSEYDLAPQPKIPTPDGEG